MNYSLNGNWVDLIILFVLAFFILQAFRVGFIMLFADFVSFLSSLLIAFRFYSYTGVFLEANFNLSRSLANALGFLLTALLVEIILGLSISYFMKKLPEKAWNSRINKYFGIIPALGEGLVVLAFIFTLAMSLPINPTVKSDISESKIGGFIIQKTSGVESKINEVFGGVIQDTLTYLTVKPGSGESVALDIRKTELSIDIISEQDMFELVNTERRKAGVSELTLREEVVPVSRNHATDMWQRQYFSHYSPDGEDVGSRLQAADVVYRSAGENLALAPTLSTAHTGLMNSEGHRANILEPSFKRIGIGVIDNGVYGKMFVQVFTD